MIDYFFVKCIDDKGTVNLLKKGTINSTNTNINDPHEYMYYINEINSFWNYDRFTKVRVPDADPLIIEVNSLFSDIDY
jgi:hypothetical protein